MDDVLGELGEPVVVDYMRLNIDATALSRAPARAQASAAPEAAVAPTSAPLSSAA